MVLAQLAFRADQTLRKRRLRHEERPCDLRSLEPTEEPKGEGHLRIGVQRRMAAEEEEPQPIVGQGIGQVVDVAPESLVHVSGICGVQRRSGTVAGVAGGLTTEAVDGPVPRSGGDPAARVRRHTLHRPLLGGHREGLRHRVLGQVDVAEDADQAGGAAPGLAAEGVDELVVHPWNGRTSTGSSHAKVPRFAQSSAVSRSGTSMIQKPPIISLVST